MKTILIEAAAIFAAVVQSLTPASADVIASFTTPGEFAFGNRSRNLGQSVTTPGFTRYGEVSFNFFEGAVIPFGIIARAPLAEGELFLLAEEYTGRIDAISSSTLGFVAQTETIRPEDNGTEWVFDASVFLEPATRYYLYARNQERTVGTIKTFNDGRGIGGGYYQEIQSNYQANLDRDWQFELEGTAVPEPASCVLMIAILGAGAPMQRRVFAS